jgi:hypothetical protein
MSKIGEYNGIFSYLNRDSDDKDEIKHYINNIFTGIKWQCVEFVRRYFILKHNLTFRNVKNVYDMMSINVFYDINNQRPKNIIFIREMNDENPRKDDIIYIKRSVDDSTGHVGLVSHYDEYMDSVYIVDQNGGTYWETNAYACVMSKCDPSIIGWCRVLI